MRKGYSNATLDSILDANNITTMEWLYMTKVMEALAISEQVLSKKAIGYLQEQINEKIKSFRGR